MIKLGYEFKDQDLWQLALSHRSVGAHNNERLEFLGDSLINCIVAKELFDRFPDASEGQLTRMRAQLVCAEMLVKLAKELNISKHIVLGPGETRSGGHQRKSILADSLEAIIGAIYIDSGESFPIVRECVLSWFVGRFEEVDRDLKDSKTVLQELLQGQKLALPVYEVVGIKGDHHNQTFHVQCNVGLLDEPVVGMGSSRRKAEQEAADLVLKKLNGK